MTEVTNISLARKATREGILLFVEKEIKLFNNEIWQSISTGHVLACKNETCSLCIATLYDKISEAHRLGRPSLINFNYLKWKTDPWQLAKCFMPESTHRNANSPKETDLNGLLSIIYNCKHFHHKTNPKLFGEVNL